MFCMVMALAFGFCLLLHSYDIVHESLALSFYTHLELQAGLLEGRELVQRDYISMYVCYNRKPLRGVELGLCILRILTLPYLTLLQPSRN